MEKPPKKSTGREVTEAVIEGGVGMIPIAGNPIAVAFAFAMGWAHNKRMQTWLDDLADAVNDLQEREHLTLDELRENEIFVDAVINATRAAQATHQAAKFEALRNAVVNSVGRGAPDIDEQAQFFRFVERFTPSHLAVLDFMDDPGAVFDRDGRQRPNLTGSRGALLEHGLPNFAGRREWADLLAADLGNAGLVRGNLQGMVTNQGLYQSLTSDFGQRFLRFIRDS